MQSLTQRQKRWTLVAVSLAVFMTTVDNTVVNVALPSIRTDLGLGQSALEWIVDGYILAFATLLLTGGRVGDLFGRRRAFLAGLAVFTGASLLGGFADSAATLVGARVLLGVGAALVTPATLAIISAAFPADERGKAIGGWAAVGALGFALGPVAGGLLAEHAGWSWIFWLNVPLGALALAVGRRAIVESRDESAGRTLDPGGILGSGAGLFALTYALIEANRYGWRSPAILGLLTAAAAAFALFVRHERRVAEPMLELALFRRRTFAAGNLLLVLAGFGLFGVFFFLSLYLQGIVGLSPVQGGLAFTPMAAVIVVAAPLSARLAERAGADRVVSTGLLLFAIGLYLMSRADAGSTYLDVLPGLLVASLGSALTTPLTTAVLASVPVEKAGIASGALNTSRELAGALGIAVLGAILAARRHAELGHGATASAAFVSGYSLALLIGAGVMLVGAVVAAIALHEPRSLCRSWRAPTPAERPRSHRRPNAAAPNCWHITSVRPSQRKQRTEGMRHEPDLDRTRRPRHHRHRGLRPAVGRDRRHAADHRRPATAVRPERRILRDAVRPRSLRHLRHRDRADPHPVDARVRVASPRRSSSGSGIPPRTWPEVRGGSGSVTSPRPSPPCPHRSTRNSKPGSRPAEPGVFFNALTGEVMPFVEQRYRSDPSRRTLVAWLCCWLLLRALDHVPPAQRVPPQPDREPLDLVGRPPAPR